MGRASRAKQLRRMSGTAEIEVVCPGMLEVLSIGKGDIKLSIDGNNPEDVRNARQLIEEMMHKGYGVFVETDRGLSRVKKFNPARLTYTISEFPDPEIESAKPPAKRRTKVTREVPMAGTKAKAIGRTAGG